MTPKEKAKEMMENIESVGNYLTIEMETGNITEDYGVTKDYAQKVALIFVNELISVTRSMYWKEVKSELIKL